MAQDVQLVIFKLANEDYGLPIQKVQEINRIVPVTRLPQTPDFMEGIINLRGRVIPVVDLRKRFGLTAKPHEDDTRIMIVDIGGQTVGISVDPVVTDNGWIPVIGNERLSEEPIRSTYWRFTYPDFQQTPAEGLELQILALGENEGELRGLWAYTLVPRATAE